MDVREPQNASPFTTDRYPWPVPPGELHQPVWTGLGFQLGSRRTGVLSYATGDSGWTDDLTTFHEDTAGSNHPIDRASRDHALGELARLGKTDPVVMEIGCSSGFFLKLVRQRLSGAFVMGADYVRGPLDALAETDPDLPLLQFDLCRCPLPDQSIDAVVLLNVLEHIPDHIAALRQVYRILRPGGAAIIEVPAGPHLFDVYDELLMHCRRYRMTELRMLVEDAGFVVEHASHLGVLVYPAFYLVKRWNRRWRSHERALQERRVAQNIRSTASNPLMSGLMRLERDLGRYIDWPVGIRCLVTARRPF